MGNKGEVSMAWVVGIIFMICVVPILWVIITNATTGTTTLYYNITNHTNVSNADEEYEFFTYIPVTLNHTPVLDVAGVEYLWPLSEGDDWNHTGNVVTLINETLNDSTLRVLYNYTLSWNTTTNYTTTTYGAGYITNPIARVVLGIVVVMFVLAILWAIQKYD